MGVGYEQGAYLGHAYLAVSHTASKPSITSLYTTRQLVPADLLHEAVKSSGRWASHHIIHPTQYAPISDYLGRHSVPGIVAWSDGCGRFLSVLCPEPVPSWPSRVEPACRSCTRIASRAPLCSGLSVQDRQEQK